MSKGQAICQTGGKTVRVTIPVQAHVEAVASADRCLVDSGCCWDILIELTHWPDKAWRGLGAVQAALLLLLQGCPGPVHLRHQHGEGPHGLAQGVGPLELLWRGRGLEGGLWRVLNPCEPDLFLLLLLSRMKMKTDCGLNQARHRPEGKRYLNAFLALPWSVRSRNIPDLPLNWFRIITQEIHPTSESNKSYLEVYQFFELCTYKLTHSFFVNVILNYLF